MSGIAEKEGKKRESGGGLWGGGGEMNFASHIKKY